MNPINNSDPTMRRPSAGAMAFAGLLVIGMAGITLTGFAMQPAAGASNGPSTVRDNGPPPPPSKQEI
jgi:hypothetical protein